MDEKEMITTYGFSTKNQMLNQLQAYLENPDDDVIRLKNKLKEKMMKCPMLLWALHDERLEQELFDENGNLNDTGEWDAYFGSTSLIRPFLFIPETQDIVTNYLCYQVHSDENMRYNSSMKYLLVTFTIFIHGQDSVDKETSIQRHDLIASILREIMAWSGFGTANAVPVGNKESVTDNNYITRVIQYQITLPNDLVTTKSSETLFVNKTKE